MKISVLIVNYNTNKYLSDCLKSLPNDLEIIVVDNNSQEKPESSKTKIILNNKNLGFAKAVNIGLKAATGEYILLLNPDTKVSADAINKMINFYENHKDCGIIAPKLIGKNTIVQKSVRRFPSITGAFKEYILSQKGEYDFYLPAICLPAGSAGRACYVDVAVGACMLIKKDLFVKLGGLNEKYFLYYEDIDLCQKIKKAGFKVYYLPEVEVYHEVGSSSDKDSYNLLAQSSKIYHGFLTFQLINFIIKLSRLIHQL